jgi:hypothetical protein
MISHYSVPVSGIATYEGRAARREELLNYEAILSQLYHFGYPVNTELN